MASLARSDAKVTQPFQGWRSIFGTLTQGWTAAPDPPADPTLGWRAESFQDSWRRCANSYEIQTSVDPVTASSWAFKKSAPKSSVTIDGLTSGTKMWVRVRAVGAGNATGPWSDPATKTVP